MKRRRVGGVDDGEVPALDEEVEMEVRLPQHRAAVETVAGQRVVCIYGVADVKSVQYHEGDDYADAGHFSVLRLCLKEATAMMRHLAEVKTTKQPAAMRVGNASSLLEASALRSALSGLSEDLSQLHEGLRNNRVVWELVSHARAMPALPLNHQPGILRDGIEILVAGVRATLTAFPAEPAGRHAGPNTIHATSSYAAEVYADLAARVRVHLDEIDALLADPVDYPNVPLASFMAWDEEPSEEQDYKRIRGLDHLRLLLTLSEQNKGPGPLTEFCVSQLYLGDANDMLQELTAAMGPPYMYCFANFDRVKGACEIKNIVLGISQALRNIADGLGAGQINRRNLQILEDLESKFLKPALGQGLTGAFRAAACQLDAGLMELLDLTANLVDAGEGGGAPSDLVTLVERLLQQVGSFWGISIEYPDESLPDVLQEKAVVDD